MAKKKKTTAKKSPDEERLSFEESLSRLESIVNQLETGKIGLNESLEKYQQGIKYLNSCHQSLKDVEREIKQVVSMDKDGNARLVPFENVAPTTNETANDEQSNSDNDEQSNSDNDEDQDDSQGLADADRLF